MIIQRKLFFSYAHEDEGLRDKLVKHLRTLERRRVIAGWHDRRITSGKEWAGRIDTYLATARIILLLIGLDFIASDYCYDIEMQQVLAQHEASGARLIPIGQMRTKPDQDFSERLYSRMRDNNLLVPAFTSLAGLKPIAKH